MPVEIAPGRGDLQYPSGFFPTFPTALAMVGYRAVSFARLFQSQPWIASAVMRQLTWAIRVPLRLYRKTGDPNAPEKVTADEHPLAAALENPWLGGSSIDLTMALLGPVLIHGNSATPILSGADDTIQFDPKDWRYTRPIMPWRDSLVGFQFDVDNAELMQTYSLDDVLHIKWWSPIGPIGTSPLQQLGVTLQIEDAAQRVQRATFMHGANPGAALVASEAFLGIKPDERRAILAQLRQDVSALYAGPENAGRPLLLPPGLDWKPAGQTTVEAALVEQRLVAREEVCGVYQIQPPMLGILDKSNKANFDTLREMTYTDTLGPPLVLIEKSLTAQICRDLLVEDDLFLEFDFRAVLRGDPLKEIDHVRSAIGAALMSPNEGRGVLRLGKSDNPAMDDYYLPTNNLQPIGTPARSMVTPVVPFTPDQPPDPSGAPDPAGRRLHVRSRDRDYDKLLAYQYDS